MGELEEADHGTKERHLRRSKRLLAFLAPALCALSFGVASAAAEPPQVTAPQVLSVSYTTAEVGGEVDARGEFTQYNFEVSADGGVSWESKGPLGAAEGSTLEPVPPWTMGELVPGTTYQVRLGAKHLFTESEWTYSSLPNPEFTTPPVAAPGVTISAPDSVTGTSARFSGSITPGTPAGDPAAYDVEWRFECTPACPGSLGGTIPADSTTTEVEVEATAEGLTAGTDYEVTLVASNKGGTTSDGPEHFSTPTIVPVVSDVVAYPQVTEALLEARVNPGGLTATYYIEYGPTAAYGSVTPVGSLSLGGVPVQVSKSITGLAPEVSYHYQLVATNSLGTTTSGDRTFTTQPPAPVPGSCPNETLRTENNSKGLPDCRAYEKVSPAEKSDQPITFNHSASSPSGNTISYAGFGALGGTEGTGVINTQVVGSRGDAGWGVHPLIAPVSPPVTNNSLAFPRKISVDGTEVAFFGGASTIPGALPGNNLYLRNGLTAALRLVNPAPLNSGATYEPTFGAASDDFNHVAFLAAAALTPGAPEGVGSVYRWDDGQLQLASVLPSGEAALEGSVVAPSGSQPSRRAMSSDGSRLFFAAGPEVSGGTVATSTYLREGDHTTEITASQKTASLGKPGKGLFRTATPDGSKAFFTSGDQLTNDSEATPGKADLYRFDAETHELIDLTPTPGGAQVAGVIGDASTDGTYVYFVAGSQLDGSRGTAGEPNLYLWHEGEPIQFIATLNGGADSEQYNLEENHHPWRLTTPNGRHLVFTSVEPLTGYPSHGFPEVYAYDADRAELTCVSCNPSGAPAEGGAALAEEDALGQMLQARRASNDAGTRVFFNSRDALVAADSNGVLDVYEWEAAGTGSCRSSRQNGGCVYLISTGTSPIPSHYADASADGSDVFFTTSARLTATDEDSLADLYDARVGGGYPPPPEPQSCAGEACRGPGSSSGSATSPGSMSFSQPPAPSLRVSKARSKPGKEASLKVTVGEPGKLSWSGSGIAQHSKHLKRAGSSTIQVSLSAAAARKLRADGGFQTKLRLSFSGAAGRGTVRSIALNFTSPAQPASKSSERNG